MLVLLNIPSAKGFQDLLLPNVCLQARAGRGGATITVPGATLDVTRLGMEHSCARGNRGDGSRR
jgi:hypothetical protein